MGILEMIVLGLALALDASCVSIANTFNYKYGKKEFILTALLFGLLQGLMPLLGYYLGSIFEDFLQTYSAIIAFVVLGYFGVHMIIDNYKEREDLVQCGDCNNIKYSVLFIQGVVTSIDAFLIGLSFVGLGYNMIEITSIVAIVTFLTVFVVCNLGNTIKKLFHRNAKLIGGIVLILIGLKVLLEAYL